MFKIRLSPRFSVNPLLFALGVVYMAMGRGMTLMAYIPAILVHELAHMLSARACGIGFLELEVLPFGCRAVFDDMGRVSASKEILTVFLGPAANIAFAGALIALLKVCPSPYLHDLMMANLGIAAINLLPALPLDGGRIMRALLCLRFSRGCAVKALCASGIAFAAAMVALSLYTLYLGQMNLSLMVMGLFLGMSAIKELSSRKQAFADYVKKRSRMSGLKSMDTNIIAVSRDRALSDVIGELNASKYNVVYVINPDMGRAHSLDEKDILNAALSKNARVKIGDVKSRS